VNGILSTDYCYLFNLVAINSFCSLVVVVFACLGRGSQRKDYVFVRYRVDLVNRQDIALERCNKIIGY